MTENDVNRYPIQLLVNYWEFRPTLIGAHLDELLRRGVTKIASFVPWQAVESDISHGLPRFLQAACERKMTVSLVLSPEVGVHFPNSGIPKELLAKSDQLAKNSENGNLISALPPNVFKLPSPYSTEYTKRYYSFLSRMDSLLADLSRSQTGFAEHVKILLSGSFWKYIRPTRACALEAFSGRAGDFSNAASLSFRQHLEQFFSQREFQESTPQSANRWRSSFYEDVCRKAFFQQSEEVFRHRSLHHLKKKSSALQISEIELYTPEADPSMVFSRFLQTIDSGAADFSKISEMLDETSFRIGSGKSVPMIHWSAMGSFSGACATQGLTDSEKQFLILKSLLIVGSRGGSIFMDEAQWNVLKPGFRARVENYARHLAAGDLKHVSEALYLTPHLWSEPGMLWSELAQAVGPRAQLVSSFERAFAERSAKLLVVDPSFILTREDILKLVSWSKSGRTLVVPLTTHLTEAAKLELEKALAGSKKIQVSLGAVYSVHALGDGKWVSYLPSQAGSAPQTQFLTAILAIADLESKISLSATKNSKASFFALAKRDGGQGLFVLNGSKEKISVEIKMSEVQKIADLSTALAAPGSVEPVEAERLTLDIPPCGILPLSLDSLSDIESELPGFQTEIRHEQPSASESTQQGKVWS